MTVPLPVPKVEVPHAGGGGVPPPHAWGGGGQMMVCSPLGVLAGVPPPPPHTHAHGMWQRSHGRWWEGDGLRPARPRHGPAGPRCTSRLWTVARPRVCVQDGPVPPQPRQWPGGERGGGGGRSCHNGGGGCPTKSQRRATPTEARQMWRMGHPLYTAVVPGIRRPRGGGGEAV